MNMNFNLDDGIAVLERTPSTLRALLAGLPNGWLITDEGPDTFTPFDNVGHLIHGERTDWIPRARIILGVEPGADGGKRFAPVDRFAHRHESAEKSLDEMLDEFARRRTHNLGILRSWRLGAHQLALEGEHPTFGRVTLGQLLATWVAHDLGHLAQVARVMAKRYRDDVGPWRAFLPVLDR